MPQSDPSQLDWSPIWDPRHQNLINIPLVAPHNLMPFLHDTLYRGLKSQWLVCEFELWTVAITSTARPWLVNVGYVVKRQTPANRYQLASWCVAFYDLHMLISPIRRELLKQAAWTEKSTTSQTWPEFYDRLTENRYSSMPTWASTKNTGSHQASLGQEPIQCT